MQEIFNRRSIRKFLDKPVEQDKIRKLLQAAMQAPSAGNQQPWEFIVVEDKETLNRLSLMTPYSKPAAGAPVAFVLLADCRELRHSTFWPQDLGAAVENILLEAVHLELGAVWMGVATNESAEDFITELFHLPDFVNPFAVVAVGYPDGQKNEFTDRYKPEKVHYEKWD